MISDDNLAALRDDPALFVRVVIGAEPQPWQILALNAVRDHPRVAIKSCHGVGKSAYLSWLSLYWICTRVPSKVPATAPTHHQLQDVLAAETQKWARQMPLEWRNLLEFKSDQVRLAGAPDTGVFYRVSRRDTPVALQGFHSPNLLFVCDEASAIDNIIFETAAGSLSTPGSKIVLCGNPTQTQGYFYDAFTKNAARWHTMTVGHADSPMVDPEWVDQMRQDYGEDSSVFKIRCMGEFAQDSDDTVIAAELVTSSFNRDIADTDDPEIWGLDVARSGSDATALVKRKGPVIKDIKVWRNKDLMQTCGMVLAEFESLPPSQRPESVNVDVIGIGAGVCDRLSETMSCSVRGINVAESPALKARFRRLRDELWFAMREYFEGRDVRCVESDQLLAELTAPRYVTLSDGKIQVESKPAMRKRGHPSPDCADALALTLSGTAAMLSGGSRGGYASSWNRPIKQPTTDWIV